MFVSSSELELIGEHAPQARNEDSLMRAAVAIILRDPEHAIDQNSTEFLMMQRAHHQNDPWSGQMAFPGGKIDPSDPSAKAAAIREVQEEMGFTLADSDFVGQLDDLLGLKADGVYIVRVSCFVFKLKAPVEITPNYEVADTVWLPFSYLNEVGNTHPDYQPKNVNRSMPAVLIDADKEQILWGMSLRILSGLFELLDWPMQAVSDDDRQALKNMDKHNIQRKKLSKKMLEAIDLRNKQ